MGASHCDLRPGISIGIRVIEFVSGDQLHSKMPLSQSSAHALLEEMINLQDMGICNEKIISKKCILKYQKLNKTSVITLYRDQQKWTSWNLRARENALNYFKALRQAGFCH